MILKKGILKSFDSGVYTASIQLAGSRKAYLEGVAVARNITPTEIIEGQQVAVVFFDERNARQAVVIAIFD